MNLSPFLLAAPALVLTMAGCNSTPDSLPWQTYVSTNGKYSVLVPGSPQEYIDTMHVDGQTLQRHRFVIKLVDPGMLSAYKLSYLDYPPGTNNPADAEKKLDLPIERANLPTTAVMNYKKKITVEGAPGIEFQYKDGSTYVTSRIIVQGDRFFQMSALTQQKQLDLGSDRKFLDSFKLMQ